tara:strand:+ start:82 stop:453 length:372 start_codon:yes stop_codon:yes gene_type:complete
LGSVKYNIIKSLLQLNLKVGRKLTYLLAKYEADEYAINNDKIDLRSIPRRIKNVMLHDQDIIDRRLSMCQGCEHFISATSQCKKCGCFMKVKTKLATARCPVGKWEKEYDFIKGKKVGSLITN